MTSLSTVEGKRVTSVVAVSAVCTAVGKFDGLLAEIAAPEPGVAVIREALARAKAAPNQVSEAIMGQMLTADSRQNPVRQAIIKAGLSNMVLGLTINKVCGSGPKIMMLATSAIITGGVEIVVADGRENMSAAPHVLPGSHDGFHMGDVKLTDSMTVDGLWDVHNQYHMGIMAESVTKEYGIMCETQDKFAIAPRNKTEVTQRSDRFNDEIVPILIPQCKGDPIAFAQGELIRHGATPGSMTGLKPAFDKAGTVTAANASGLDNGITAAIVMSVAKAEELGLTPLATIRVYASTNLDPKVMGMGSVPASKRCLPYVGWSTGDLGLMEISETFVAQALAVHQQMGWDTSKINVNGGAVTIGHLIDASGCHILVTLLHEMQKRDAKKDLVSLCIGSGMGVALIIERP